MAPQLPAPPRPPAEPERVASGAGASAPTGAGGSRLKTACMMFQVGAIHCVILSLFLTRAPLPTAPLFLPFLAHSTPPLVILVPSPTQEGRCTLGASCRFSHAAGADAVCYKVGARA